MEVRKLWKTKSTDEISCTVESLFGDAKNTNCPVNTLKHFSKAAVVENCGECVICREGIYQLYVQTESVSQGAATEDDYLIMKEIAETMKETSHCEFGSLVGGKVLETLIENEEDIMKHIKRKRCEAKVCEKLSNFQETVERKEGGLMGGHRRRKSE